MVKLSGTRAASPTHRPEGGGTGKNHHWNLRRLKPSAMGQRRWLTVTVQTAGQAEQAE